MATEQKKYAVIYSFFNNYELLANEVIPRMEKFQDQALLVIVDDKSNQEQRQRGLEICIEEGLIFLDNSGKGLAQAVDTAINYLCERKITDLDWVFCSQQDIYPKEASFFTDFSESLDLISREISVGAVGFNALDRYYSAGSTLNGLLGSFFLAKKPKIKDRLEFVFSYANLKHIIRFPLDISKAWIRFHGHRRLFSPQTFKNFDQIRDKYSSPFSIELPMWAFVGLNVNIWRRTVDPLTGLVFHLWFNDIAMQLLSQSKHILVFPDLLLENHQEMKIKYGLMANSADAGRAGRTDQVEKYGKHLEIFQNRWGFDYESPWKSSAFINAKYADTLVSKHFTHDIKNGPIDFNS